MEQENEKKLIEEREAIRIAEYQAKVYKETEMRNQRRAERQKEQERLMKEKLKKRTFAFRTFAVTIATAAVMATGVVALNNNEQHNQRKAAYHLNNEIQMHGGYQLEGDYKWDLNKHLELGCNLDYDGSMAERIQDYCEKNNLSDQVCDYANMKYELYSNNHFKEGDKINLIKIVKEEQKELSENDTYGIN